MRFILYLCCFLYLIPAWSQSSDSGDNSLIQRLNNMPNASLLIDVDDGHNLRPNQPMIPASTVKILTALLALETWGPHHRFVTDFHLDDENILWIKGYGDPFLISEEIDKIVSALLKRGLSENGIQIEGIGIDDSFFSSEIMIDGQSSTDNPYDAPLGSLVANFNTLNVAVSSQGIQSAESQTPLTPLAKSLARSLSTGKHRINLGQQIQSSHYFAELLREKLSVKGVAVKERILMGIFPQTTDPLYQHRNSHELATVISAMLQYSNNFIANQLFLLLGVVDRGQPATMEKSRSTTHRMISELFTWQEYVLLEGAGLSRKNRLSARQLIDVLNQFKQYSYLLSAQNSDIKAKSGTLKGVSTYAGYLKLSKGWTPFALMINQAVEYDFRKRLADSLLTEYN